MSIGPIQFVVVGFEGDVLESDVLQELLVAGAGGAIRLLDFLILERDEDGQLWAIDVVDDSAEEKIGFGALAYGLIEQGAVEAEVTDEGVKVMAISDPTQPESYRRGGIIPSRTRKIEFSTLPADRPLPQLVLPILSAVRSSSQIRIHGVIRV